jgi:hypothetical protein
VDGAEDRFMETDDAIKKDIQPRVAKMEKTTVGVVKDLAYFKDNIGDDMVAKVKSLEASVKAFEAHAGAGNAPELAALRGALVNEIMPALRDLWEFYMMATKGPGLALRPDSKIPAGEHLVNRISVLETALRMSTNSHGGTLGIEQRLRNLESQTAGGTTNPVGIPSLFSQNLGGVPMTTSGLVAPAAVGGVGSGLGATMAADLTVRVNTLFSRVKELDAQLGNVTVICGGQSFRLVEDCETFIVAHVPGNTYAHFYDMVSLLQ